MEGSRGWIGRGGGGLGGEWVGVVGVQRVGGWGSGGPGGGWVGVVGSRGWVDGVVGVQGVDGLGVVGVWGGSVGIVREPRPPLGRWGGGGLGVGNG